MHRFALFAAFFAVACEGDDTKDTADTGDVSADPIAANGIQVSCDNGTSVTTISPDISGAPSEVLLTAADFANAQYLIEENNFTFDAGTGAIEDLTLDVVAFPASNPGETAITCDQYNSGDTSMVYAVRAYDDTDALADCAVGEEATGNGQGFIDDMGASSGNGAISNPSELASCDVDLAISY